MKKITSICIVIATVILVFGVGYFTGRSRNEQIESDLWRQLGTEKAYRGQTKLRAETAEDQCLYWLRVIEYWANETRKRVSKEDYEIIWTKAGDVE